MKSKMNLLPRIWIMGVLLAGFCLSAIAQTTSPSDWQRVESKKRDFSVLLPEDLNVFRDSQTDRTVVMSTTSETSVQVTFWNEVDGKRMLDDAVNKSQYGKIAEAKLSTIGKHKILFAAMSHNAFNAELHIADSKTYYTVNISAKSSNDHVEKVLKSILLDGAPILKQSGPATTLTSSESVISVKDLKATAGLVDSNGDKKALSKIVKDDADFAPAYPDVFLSRHLLVLNKERPRYTEEGRMNNIQGDVILHVEYKADGTVGRIAVKKYLGGGLTEEAVRAAQKISFVPAQVDGKAIDTSGFQRYSFSIY